MKLIITWPDFSRKIEHLINDYDTIVSEMSTVKGSDEFEELKEKINNWSLTGSDLLKSSFDPPNEVFAREFFHASVNRFSIRNQAKDIGQLKKELLEDFREKRQTL